MFKSFGYKHSQSWFTGESCSSTFARAGRVCFMQYVSCVKGSYMQVCHNHHEILDPLFDSNGLHWSTQSTLSCSLNFWCWMRKPGSWTPTNHFYTMLSSELTNDDNHNVPLNRCLFVVRTVTHGGHLGDCWHRQQIYALIERFLGPSLGCSL